MQPQRTASHIISSNHLPHQISTLFANPLLLAHSSSGRYPERFQVSGLQFHAGHLKPPSKYISVCESYHAVCCCRRPFIKLPLFLILFIAMAFEYIIRPLLSPIKELTTDFTVFR